MALCFHVNGVVIKEGTTAPQPGLTVRLYRGPGKSRQLVAQTRTDKAGRFAFEVRAPEELQGDSVYSLAVQDKRIRLKASGDIRWTADRSMRGLVVCVEWPEQCAVPDISTPSGIQDTHVLVLHDDGTPVPGLLVQLVEITFSDETVLKDAVANQEDGWYGFSGLVSGTRDVYVKVTKPAGGGDPPKVVGTSRVKYGIDPTTAGPLRFDVYVCEDSLKGASEYSRISDDIAQVAGVPVGSLDSTLNSVDIRKVVLASGKTGWPLDQAVDRTLAAQLNDLMSEPSQLIGSEALYGLLREGFPQTANEILARPPSAVQAALSRAVYANTIGSAVDIPTVQAALLAAHAKLLDSASEDSMGAILRTSADLSQSTALTNLQITEFCALYAGHTGTTDDFWNDVDNLASFTTTAHTIEAKRLITLGTIALGHAPCVTGILQSLGTSSAETVAGWSSATWDTVSAAITPLPGGLEGNTTQQRDQLAQLLSEHAALAFPQQQTHGDLSGSIGTTLGVDQVFGRIENKDLDLRTIRITDTTVTFDPDPATREAEKTALLTAQRLYLIAPQLSPTAAMERLHDRGFRSAQSVVQRGRARFIDSYAGGDISLLGEAVEIYRKAENQTALSSIFYASANPTLDRAALNFIPDASLTVSDDEVVNWSSLFSVPGGTRCDWCQSIHGPAAYLVDLLHWLETKTPPTGTTTTWASVLDGLQERRPDLLTLPLTCENATRVLPFIDLTLEVLEGIVDAGVSTLTAHTSEAETSEMLAAPQYTIEAAYSAGKLGDYRKSFLTPFHQPLHEGRAFLKHLGVDRADLMRTFTAGGTPSEAQIAHEDLGLSAEARDAILGTGSESDYWPISTTAAPTVKDFRFAAGITYDDILDLLHTRTANPDRGGVGGLLVVMAAGADPYDVSNYTIQRIDAVDGSGNPTSTSAPQAAQFTAMRRVLRLWRAMGWRFQELDRVLAALGASTSSTWDDNTLIHLGNIRRLEKMTGLEPVELAAWFGQLDTYLDRETADDPFLSLYDQTFLSPSLFPLSTTTETVEDPGPPVEMYQTFPFSLNATRSDVDTASLAYFEIQGEDVQGLRDHHERLRSVLGVDESEVEALIVALEGLGALTTWLDTRDDPDVTVPELTLGNLSALYRWCSAARVLGILPSEAVRLFALTGAAGEPFDTTTSTIAFIEDARELLGAGWSVNELDYLLQHGAVDRAAPTEEYLQGLVGRIRDSASAQSDDTEDAVRIDALIRQVADEFGVERFLIDWLNENLQLGAVASPANPSYPAFLGSDLEYTQLNEILTTSVSVTLKGNVTANGGAISLSENDKLLVLAGTSIFQSDAAPANTPCSVDGSGNLALLRTRTLGEEGNLPVGAFYEQPSAPGITITLDGPVTATLDNDVDVDTAQFPPSAQTFQELFTRFLRADFLSGTGSDETNPWSDITADSDTYAEDIAVVTALHKAVVLLGKLDADEEEAEAWFARIADWGLLNPTLLSGGPMSALAATSADAFGSLQTLARLFLQRERLPGTSPSFAELVGEPTAANIAARTDWSEDDLSTLINALTGDVIDAVADLEVVLDQMAVLRRTGTSPTAALGWAAAGDLTHFTSTQSREIIEAARSRYTDADTWSSVARPVRDVLRKAQRDALVSYLLAESGGVLQDADDLYEEYLIDVSMNPEMLTSRIVQAAASVQLFIHRTFFGLEQDDNNNDLGLWFNEDDRAEWEWMRTYRVWEAARKVFLYPENWIEPELRDDKTPFFEKLEQELAQGDITRDRTEQVVLNYLDRLLGVASLQMLACHLQKEEDGDGATDILHVFARSRGEPATYWYCRREDGLMWTAWEEIKAGVQGNHLVPVIHNRRLMLFWAEFMDAQSSNEGDDPNQWWDVRIAMSEYRDGTWSAKTLSTEAMSLNNAVIDSKAPTESYGLSSSVDADGQLVLLLSTVRTNAVLTEFYYYNLGTFTLNSCTMEMSVSLLDTGETDRYALYPGRWKAPGYTTEITSTEPVGLDVYLGETNTDGTPSGQMEVVEVLNELENATVVVPSQWEHFVSQSPFFVNVGERAYLVEPIIDGDGDIESNIGDTPAIAGLSSHRSGTFVSTTPAPELDDDTARGYASMYPESEYVSDTQAVRSIKSGYDALTLQGGSASLTGRGAAYRFSNFYHPYACRFISEVRRQGVFGLLDPDPEGTSGDLYRQAAKGSATDFEDTYSPTALVESPYPLEEIDFAIDNVYSAYNWEIFFHIPLLIANRLADAGRFQDAIDWFHTMFDPRTRTDATTSGIEGAVEEGQWWKVQPLVKPVSAPVTDWVGFTGANDDPEARRSYELQVAAWRQDPFNPHLIARLRSGVYPRALVMRYIDTLIAWGDQLFGQDTLETINEATQLYVFARQVLGERPELLGAAEKPEPKSYSELELDDFSNALVAIENSTFLTSNTFSSGRGLASLGGLGYTSYFCVPFNHRLLSYWDTVADRLFKIRNGMNIDGVVRSLPLFQPPIDPAMLVRAAAAGVDIGSLTSSSTEDELYRFSVMLGRAQGLAGSVQRLGGALQSAIERRDAEELALLRQGQEQALLKEIESVREKQVEEAKLNLAATRQSKRITQARFNYYDRLIDKGWIGQEEAATTLNGTAEALSLISSSLSGIGAYVRGAPDVLIGPLSAVIAGGDMGQSILSGYAAVFGAGASLARGTAAYLSTTATYKRREQDWKQQRRLAKRELKQIEKSIRAAEMRVEIATRELSNHQLQMQHSATVQSWMELKYSNQELYDWMIGQLSALHFQAWQLAYATAKKAEACYQRELGRTDSFVQAVHWDSTRKGLLAGERLQRDLERMDLAYLNNNLREAELTKHVSMSRLDPVALERLRQDGECVLKIPEALFDLDCPGHYFRRLQSVAVTIACVSGAQRQINMKLTLDNHYLRREAGTSALDVPEPSPTKKPYVITSAAVEDPGLFSPDGSDGRYTPFERRGAVSDWQLQFCNRVQKQFDWNTISDVVLHLRYTACDGSEESVNSLPFHQVVTDDLPNKLGDLSSGMDPTDGLVVALSAKRDMPDEWHQAQSSSTLTVPLGENRLPYFATGWTNKIKKIHVISSVSGTVDITNDANDVVFNDLTMGTATSGAVQWPADGSGLYFNSTGNISSNNTWPESLSLTLESSVQWSGDDVLIVIEYGDES